MKRPLNPAKLFLPAAVISMCILAIQACVTTNKPGTVFGHTTGAAYMAVAREHAVTIPASERKFARALKDHAVPDAYDTYYCEQRGKTIECDAINPKTIGNFLDRPLKTTRRIKSQRAESGAGDDVQSPTAIHVSQWASFKTEEDLVEFLNAVSNK